MPKRTDLKSILIIGAALSLSVRPANLTILAHRPARLCVKKAIKSFW